MRRVNDQPRSLGDLLNTLAGRLRRVDLRQGDELQTLWREVADPVLVEHCRPEFIKDGVLVVKVPSGAFAQRVNADRAHILAGFAILDDRAPTSLRVIQGDS